MRIFFFHLAVTVVFAVFSSVKISIAGTPPGNNTVKNRDSYIIWAHSDIQPKNRWERNYYKIAIEDIRKNLPPVDMALLAGDIIQRRKDAEDDYRWFIKIRRSASIPYWFEIAGNHDARSFAHYFRFIRKPLYYSVYAGNLLIICLSDEVNNSPTEISEEAFQWWKDEVIKNQNRMNIITVTHAALPESGLLFSGIYRSKILGSKRFTGVLKKYRVDLWLSGHTSSPPGMGYNENFVKELNNTLFINISGIRKELGMNVCSRILFFKEKSNEMIIKMRDHNKRKFIKEREIRLKMLFPFRFASRKPLTKIPQGIILSP